MRRFRQDFCSAQGIRRRSAGFTLMEVLVVVTLMAVAAGAVAGFSMRRGEGVKLTADARKLRSFFLVCRSMAMSNGKIVRCEYQPDEARVSVVGSDRKLELGQGTELGVVPAKAEEPPKVPQETTTVASFYPDGAAVGGMLALLREQRKVYLVLDPVFGSVRVADSLEEKVR